MSRRSESEARYQSARTFRAPSPTSSSRYPAERVVYRDTRYDDEQSSRSMSRPSRYDQGSIGRESIDRLDIDLERDINILPTGERIIYRDQLPPHLRNEDVIRQRGPELLPLHREFDEEVIRERRPERQEFVEETVRERRPERREFVEEIVRERGPEVLPGRREFNTNAIWAEIEREDVRNLDMQLRRFSVGDAALRGRDRIVERDDFIERDDFVKRDQYGRRLVVEREEFVPVEEMRSRRDFLERDDFVSPSRGRERVVERERERDEFIERDSGRDNEYGRELVIRKTDNRFDDRRREDRYATDYRRSTGSFARYASADPGYRFREEDIIIASQQPEPAPEREVEHEREITRTYFKPVEYYRHHRSHHRSESQKRSKSESKEKALKRELKREKKKVKKLQKRLEESSSEEEEEGELIQGEGLTIVTRRHHSRVDKEEEVESGGAFGGFFARKPQPIVGFI